MATLMSVGTPVIVTHPCSLFSDGRRQNLPKSRFHPIRLFSTVDDDVERNLQSAEDGVWVLGVEQFGPETETLVREVTESNRTLKVIVLATSQNADETIRALNAGVSGFLCQDISSNQLRKSLDLILLGETVTSPLWMTALTGTRRQAEVNAGMGAPNATSYLATNPGVGINALGGLPNEMPSGASEGDASRGLSRREVSILRSLTEGASNEVIARKLVITESTVKVHMKAILRKLRLQNRIQAALWARSHLSGASDSDPCAIGILAALPSLCPRFEDETSQAASGHNLTRAKARRISSSPGRAPNASL
jgi:two-component system, NarL family, nitrate/nitrite response regulator NarL